MDDTLKKINEELKKGILRQQAERFRREKQELISSISGVLGPMLIPYLNKIVENSKANGEQTKLAMLGVGKEIANEVRDSLRGVKIDGASIIVPDIKVPEIKIPTINVPTANIEVNVPDVVMPDEMDVRGWVNLMFGKEAVGLNNPLPVQLRTADGSPFNPFENIKTLINQGGGGGPRIISLKGVGVTDGALDVNASVTLSFDTGSGEIAGETLRIVQATDAVSSVNVVGFAASVATIPTNAAGVEYDGDNPQPVSVIGFTASIAAVPTNAEGEEYSGDNPLPVSLSAQAQNQGETDARTLRVIHAGDAATSTRVIASDVSFEAKQVSGFADSVFVIGSSGTTAVVGDVNADEADTGSAPIKIGGIVRTANPTAAANGDRVSASFDSVGRQVMTPLQVRGLRATAYVALSTGTETTLLAAGGAGVYHDLIYIMGANNTASAVQVDIRSVTAGSIVATLTIPASGTAGIAMPVPLPQDNVNNNWTVDMPDTTGTTISLTALFSKEV